ncbi:similar to response regulator [hydrothermal vent metagenome]|uniref:Similar to response regulator n=1 Tax=hydrothermal vent metagenome TaxID=652676 RepID=A0A3B1E683_9ZZZZ
MTKKVLNVGQCNPDHSSICNFLEQHFDVTIDRTHQADDTLEQLRATSYDLVLINRKLDIDYTEGTEILRIIKSDAELQKIPVMIISNFAEAQEAAVTEGATYGFGKNEYNEPDVVERLKKVLG